MTLIIKSSDIYNFTNKHTIKNNQAKLNRKKMHILFLSMINRNLKIINPTKNKLGLISKSIIVTIYSAITKELLLHRINGYTDITQAELDIILACRKSVVDFSRG